MAAKVAFKYEADSGSVHNMLLSGEIGAAGGAAPDGAVDSNIKPELYKSNRAYGIRPRFVQVSRTVGTAPDTFKKYKRIPVFTPTAFASAAFALGATVAVNNIDHVVVSRFGEDY